MIFRAILLFFWLGVSLCFSTSSFAQVQKDTIRSWGKNQLRYRDGIWLVTDKKGNVASTLRFTGVETIKTNPKSKPLFLLSDNGSIALADHRGRVLTAHQFTRIDVFSPLLLSYQTVESGPLQGLVDLKGQILQPAIYSYFLHDSMMNGIRTYKPSDDTEPSQGLISFEGKILLQPKYKHLHFRDAFIIPETPDGKKGWFDIAAQRLLLPASMDSIGPLIDGYARVKVFENWGVINSKGQIILPLHYQSLFLVGNGRVLATTHPGWITSSSDTLFYKEVYPLGEHYYRIQGAKGSYLLNERGDTLSGPWESIGHLQEGSFWIHHQGQIFRIDTLGLRFKEPAYISLTQIGHNIQIGAVQGGGFRLLTASGKALIDATFIRWKQAKDGSLWLQSGLKWKLYNFDSNRLVGPFVEQPGEPCHGGYRVQVGSGTGIIDQWGKWLTGPVWKADEWIDWLKGDEILIRWGETYTIQDGNGCINALTYADSAYVSGSLVAFRLRGYWGLANEEGKVVFPAQARKINFLDSLNLWQLQNDTAYGVMDRDGCFITSFARWFDSLGTTTAPFTVIKKQARFGMIDPEGRLRISNRYEDLRPFKDGRAAFKIAGKWGFIDLSESIVIQPEYDSVDNFFGDVARVWINGYSTLIQVEGKTLIDSITIPVSQHWGYWKIQRNGKQGIIDANGKRILPAIYDDISVISPLRIVVKKGVQWGLTDEKGSWILTPDQYAIIMSANGIDEISALPPLDYSFTFGEIEK